MKVNNFLLIVLFYEKIIPINGAPFPPSNAYHKIYGATQLRYIILEKLYHRN